MIRFVTVSKEDQQFWPLLTGRFSKTEFAQPVQNLQVNSDNELVTFKIISKESLTLWQALSHWYSLARNIYLTFPLVGGLSYLIYAHGMPSLALVLSSFFGLQFFLLALTLYNDYCDYVSGVDRINEYSNQKPLVQGKVRAYQAKQLAIVFLGLSVLFSLYCFLTKPLVLLWAVMALLLGFSLTTTLTNRKFKGVSLVGTFLLGGPLLVLGYEYLLYDQITWASAFLGMAFGYHALKYDFSKQVRDIYFSSKAKLVTLSNYFGFEKSKYLYSLMSVFHLVVLTLFSWQVELKEMTLVVLVALCFEVYINTLFYGATSFLSSHLASCLSLQKLHFTIESCLIVFIFLSPQWISLF